MCHPAPAYHVIWSNQMLYDVIVTLHVKSNFDVDARRCISCNISKNTGKKPLTKPRLEVSEQWQLDLFSPACKD